VDVTLWPLLIPSFKVLESLKNSIRDYVGLAAISICWTNKTNNTANIPCSFKQLRVTRGWPTARDSGLSAAGETISSSIRNCNRFQEPKKK